MSSGEKKILQDSDRLYVGIDAGSVSLNALVINEAKAIVYELPYKRHFGKVEEEKKVGAQDNEVITGGFVHG